MDKLFITMCVIAYNEGNSIGGILECINQQDYEHEHMEVVLVDGMSTDNTKSVMLEFAEKNEGSFQRIVVLDNPKKTLPSGWNVALREYKGDAIIKVDAHAVIPQDFVSKNVGLPVITMSMGDYGKVSRVAGKSFGSAMTFGCLGKASAPGQINVDDLRAILNIL